MLWREGIWAGFAEEVTSGLGFEAQAGFHWVESQGGDLSEQESQEVEWKRPGTVEPCCLGWSAWDFVGCWEIRNSNTQDYC